MSIRSQLEKKIENKRLEIVEIEARLREEKGFLQGLQEALKVLPKEGAEERKSEQLLRPGSNMAKAREYLRQYGKPAYIADILKGIGVETTKGNRASISGSLGNYARKREIFTALGQNIFGLIEFKEPREPDDSDEPPDDFGLETEKINTVHGGKAS